MVAILSKFRIHRQKITGSTGTKTGSGKTLRDNGIGKSTFLYQHRCSKAVPVFQNTG